MNENRRCSVLFHLLVPGGRLHCGDEIDAWVVKDKNEAFSPHASGPSALSPVATRVVGLGASRALGEMSPDVHLTDRRICGFGTFGRAGKRHGRSDQRASHSSFLHQQKGRRGKFSAPSIRFRSGDTQARRKSLPPV